MTAITEFTSLSPEFVANVKSDLMGKIVSAKSASTNEPIYGEVVNIRLCIDHAPQFGRILVDVLNGGWVRVADYSTVKIQGNA